MRDLDELKISAGFTEEDQHYLRLAGEVLADQTKQIVDHWLSGIIASIPNLARHSRSPEGNALPEYLAASNLRFSAMDSGHLPPALRSRLAQLPTRNCSTAYKLEEEQDRSYSVDATLAAEGHYRIYRDHERDH
jgi:hypothetical protein